MPQRAKGKVERSERNNRPWALHHESEERAGAGGPRSWPRSLVHQLEALATVWQQPSGFLMVVCAGAQLRVSGETGGVLLLIR